MMIIFLRFINYVIEINLIAIGISWHTSCTTFFENFVYSFVSDSYVECDQIYKFIQITMITLELVQS